MANRFSDRNGFSQRDAEISIMQEAPDTLRHILVELAYELGFVPSRLRALVCRVIQEAPDPNNWSERPNIDQEVRGLLHDCEWFYIYDIIEVIYEALSAGEVVGKQGRASLDEANNFQDEINRFFRSKGFGWQLVDGRVEIRGDEAFERAVHEAPVVLMSNKRITAANEIREALSDMSRRPDPDITGAIQHAMAALECAARDLTGDQSTLGDLVRRNPDLFPKPLNQAVEKVWGYTSEFGRHLKEGRRPSYEEAEMIVGLSGILCRYIARKFSQ